MEKYFFVFCLAISFFGSLLFFSDTTFAQGNDWMSGVDDARLISHTSIPVTHDSTTFDDGTYGYFSRYRNMFC